MSSGATSTKVPSGKAAGVDSATVFSTANGTIDSTGNVVGLGVPIKTLFEGNRTRNYVIGGMGAALALGFIIWVISLMRKRPVM